MLNSAKRYVCMVLFLYSCAVIRLQAAQEMSFEFPDIDISMDFQDADLKDILKMFSVQSGLNFIASEAVQERKVTLYLDKVPVKDAIDKLFRANNLSYELDRDARIFFVKDWGKPQLETITKVFYLKYASVVSSLFEKERADQISSSDSSSSSGSSGSSSSSSSSSESASSSSGTTQSGIIDVLKKVLSSQGSVVEDARTNSIIVTDIPSKMPMIGELIALLDIPQPQIMLEVEMLDVSKGTIDKMGVKWPQTLAALDMTLSQRATTFPFSGSRFKNDSLESSTIKITDATPSGWKDVQWGVNRFGPSILSIVNAELTLDFLRTQSDTKSLARPRILTLNNQTAEIKITTNEAIGSITVQQGQGTSSSSTTSAERVETGVSLRVTPQVNFETGEITMVIIPAVKDATTSSFNANFKDPEERSSKSVVRIKDGETIILGGLIKNDYSQTNTKIPLLSDIPIMGALFRHKNKDKDKERELIVFITPHIMQNSGIELASAKKPHLPEREQNTATGFDRFSTMTSTLSNFEDKKK